MTYTLGPTSLDRLAQVHPELRQVIMRAIGATAQDFTVVQGLRTQAEAQANLASGASRTSNSLHLRQPDGYAHAVDLAAWINDKLAYEPISAFYLIAQAIQRAAKDLNITIRWGGQWDRSLNSLSANLQAEHQAYATFFQKAHGRQALMDFGHFELPRGTPVLSGK